MKRIAVTLSIIAALLLSLNLEAQERRSGFRAGYVLSASELGGTSALHGFYVGFAHDNPIGQSKLLWWHGGTEYTQAGWEFTGDTFHRLHYISLPGALKVKLGPVFIQGGIALNFKVAERVYIDGVDAKTDDNKSKIFNLPVHAGLGVMLGPVMVEARYNYGLLQVHDDGYHVGYLQLGAGLLF
jgi:hypothetical protein